MKSASELVRPNDAVLTSANRNFEASGGVAPRNKILADCVIQLLLKIPVGIGEWGMGNGEWGMGNWTVRE
ncbi:hypothetical protein FD724_06705 [Nostoc sp. C057]|nr:hypothetical protein FD724_06705 [Nostoc sp. C057]